MTCAGGTLRAQCTGSLASAYSLWVSWKNNAISDASCSCPVGREGKTGPFSFCTHGAGKCKHIAALLLYYRQNQGFVPPSPLPSPGVSPGVSPIKSPQEAEEINEQPPKSLRFSPAKAQEPLEPPPQSKKGLLTLTRTPGFSLESEWKQLQLKNPKKRKSPTTVSPSVAQSESIEMGPESALSMMSKQLQEMKVFRTITQSLPARLEIFYCNGRLLY